MFIWLKVGPPNCGPLSALDSKQYQYLIYTFVKPMNRINTILFARFLENRLNSGIPPKWEILRRIKRTSTRTIVPPGWTWK